MTRTLIIGYGNADRQDDGAAWHVLCGIATKLERPVPNVPEDGFYPEDEDIDLCYDLQLTPEMSEHIGQYDRVCFVDAHAGDIEEELRFDPVKDSAASSAFTHHMTPAALMALTRTVYKKEPEAMLLSVRGYQFGFERQISQETAVLVRQAVEILWDWIQEAHNV